MVHYIKETVSNGDTIFENDNRNLYDMYKKSEKKGEINMEASVLKLNAPFITRKKLERTPASEENRKMAAFIDSHNFSFDIDTKTGKLRSVVTKK